MTPLGYISTAFAKVANGWQDQLSQQLCHVAWDGAKDRSPEAQEKLWRRLNRLLKLGADVNALSRNVNSGRTAFTQVAWGGYDIVVARMLEAGADPNRPETPKSKTTPFLVAATMRNINMMRAMIAKGANVHATNAEGDNGLHEMLTHSSTPENDEQRQKIRDAYDFLTKDCGLALEQKTLEQLFNEIPYLAFVDPKLESAQALWSATISKDHGKMKELLLSGTPPDSARDYGHNTALHYAITGDDKDAIRLLVMARANPALAEQSIGNVAPQTMEFINAIAAERDYNISNVTAGQKVNVGRPLKLKMPGTTA